MVTRPAPELEPGFEAVAALMRAQATHRRLRPDPIDDDTVLTLLDLAARAPTSRPQRREFVVVRDPDVRHQLARSYRQGWSVYKRILRSRWSEDALLEDRQWESDHFEDVPVLVVTCLRGRRPIFPAIGAAAFYGAAFPAVQNLLLAAEARGLGASATTLPLWSVWEARRTLGLPRIVTPVSVVALGWPRHPVAGAGVDAIGRRAGHSDDTYRQCRPSRPLWPPALSRPARP